MTPQSGQRQQVGATQSNSVQLRANRDQKTQVHRRERACVFNACPIIFIKEDSVTRCALRKGTSRTFREMWSSCLPSMVTAVNSQKAANRCVWNTTPYEKSC